MFAGTSCIAILVVDQFVADRADERRFEFVHSQSSFHPFASTLGSNTSSLLRVSILNGPMALIIGKAMIGTPSLEMEHGTLRTMWPRSGIVRYFV